MAHVAIDQKRTTRRIVLTPEDKTYLHEGARVLEELAALERQVAGGRALPKGLVRMAAMLGFRRRHVAPALSRFVRQYPEVDVQLHLKDQPVHIVEQGFDLEVRTGELPDARLSVRLLAHNQRALLAPPAYLRRADTPTARRELSRHACRFIRESDETFGTWHLRQGARSESVKVRGPRASNDGESVLGWALDGHGVGMRSRWEAAPLVRAGQLVRLLPEWQLPAADGHAVFPTRSYLSAKTRVLIDELLVAFEAHRQSAEGAG